MYCFGVSIVKFHTKPVELLLLYMVCFSGRNARMTTKPVQMLKLQC